MGDGGKGSKLGAHRCGCSCGRLVGGQEDRIGVAEVDRRMWSIAEKRGREVS